MPTIIQNLKSDRLAIPMYKKHRNKFRFTNFITFYKFLFYHNDVNCLQCKVITVLHLYLKLQTIEVLSQYNATPGSCLCLKKHRMNMNMEKAHRYW